MALAVVLRSRQRWPMNTTVQFSLANSTLEHHRYWLRWEEEHSTDIAVQSRREKIREVCELIDWLVRADLVFKSEGPQEE